MLAHLNRRRERGMSLVELMIGLAIGLVVVAAAAVLLLGQIREQRAMLVEGRLMQDLRTSMDIITRDLRRSGYWGGAPARMHASASTPENPYTAISPALAASDAVSFRMSRDITENNSVDDNEQFGFRLRNGVIEMLIGGGSWQALTDVGTMSVVSFAVTPEVQELSLQGMCEKACANGASACGPTLQVRSLTVAITGRANADSKVRRTLTSQVRVRNDAVVGACSA
ncbi:MAG: prepilin-type N-terminal cleavage/methylation domain-containing protein [Burkholderiales bacterium]|jgi:prepilin peptidase dependent protein B|nr:prepilin-type N-terminal cleavage/methylation domain-containing protein [Burkholderiales bacterium]